MLNKRVLKSVITCNQAIIIHIFRPFGWKLLSQLRSNFSCCKRSLKKSSLELIRTQTHDRMIVLHLLSSSEPSSHSGRWPLASSNLQPVTISINRAAQSHCKANDTRFNINKCWTMLHIRVERNRADLYFHSTCWMAYLLQHSIWHDIWTIKPFTGLTDCNKTRLIQKPAVTSAHHEVVTVSRKIVTFKSHSSLDFFRLLLQLWSWRSKIVMSIMICSQKHSTRQATDKRKMKGAGMVQWWEHSLATNVAQVHFPDPTP